MRVAVNLEFTDEELRKYVADVGRRVVLDAIHEGIVHINALKLDPSVSNMLAHAVQRAFTKEEEPKAPAAEQRPIEAQVVTPDAAVPPPPDKCVPMPADARMDETWFCHCCGTCNGTQRVACRRCDHERCDVIITPPPAAETDPSLS